MPIFVNSFLLPKTGVPYVVEDIQFRGGYRVVSDTTARDAIESGSRKAGMLVYTQAEGRAWVLSSDLLSWSNLSQTIDSASTTVAGLMSAADKVILNSLNSNALSGLSVNSPLVTSGGKTPTLSMQYATSAQDGYLKASDWIIFNSKGAGNGTVVGVTAAAPLTASTSSSTPHITLPQASASTSGYLSSTDWNTFNNKSSGAISSVSGSLPVVVSSGTTPVVSMQAATSSVDGYLKAVDWVTFNNKGNGTVQSISAQPGSPVTVQSGVNTIVGISQASAGSNGYLTSSDWLAFNNKGNGTVQSVTASAGQPVTVTGTASNPIISMPAATASQHGYMTNADKQKLDGMASNATAYTHPTGDGNLHVPATGTSNSGKFLMAGASAGSLSWGQPVGGVVSVNGQTGTVTLDQSNITGLSTTSNTQFKSLGVNTAAPATAGEIRATDNITAYYSSDLALKENITPLDHALDKIATLTGCAFDWTKDYMDSHGGEDGYFIRKRDVGLIAQDVEAVLPEIVATKSDGYKAIKYDRVVALLVQGIKELKAEVDTLRRA